MALNVSVIGTGYVGLVTGTCFADMGYIVTCIDIDEKKIQKLKQGKSPIYEPGLNELLERNIEAKRLLFSTNYDSVKTAQVIFLAVGTPSQENGEADLSYLIKASESVGKNLSDDAIVVIKSTVPVGTHKKVDDALRKNTTKRYHVVNNPEFLKEGSAIDDFMRPDRVVIGFTDPYGAQIMQELYEPLVRQGNPIYLMSNVSAEMTKYAANCFLATKISFINEIAKLCDLTGADIEEVRKGMISDKRIGHHFLYPGPGYGGSCFPKDVRALMTTSKQFGLTLKIVEAVEQVNEEQKQYVFGKIIKHFKNDLKGKKFGFWGVAFKPKTDDIRESPAIVLAENIIKHGGKIQFYDPIAAENFKDHMKGHSDQIESYNNKYDALNGCDALVLMTEWPEFRAPDFHEISERLKGKNIFDARNIYPTEKVLEHGFKYFAVGKKID
ncbi:MAG: UDP-glucose/GDP-mannose dehydrogenase family protein [Bacteriovoracaceae bacterium]